MSNSDIPIKNKSNSSKKSVSTSFINPDIPITDKSEDKLNRGDFVDQLFTCISEYDKEDCLVIGLMGSWGSGKTSIINMVKEKNKEKNQTQIIHFNPWYFSKQNNLLHQFFNTLIKNINTNKEDVKENIQKLATFFVNSTSFKIGLEHMHLNVDPQININEDETLDNIKEKISNKLKERNKKIIIIIDDIDRLNDLEIQQIFMLVKSLADFPNIIYILLFDRKAVIESFNQHIYSPEIFMEKIIDIPITIPESKSNVLKILFEQEKEFLDKYYEKYNPIYKPEKGFLTFKMLDGVFNNVRDIKRYFNILNFYSPLTKEINIHDYMLLLVLELFEHDIYNKIKQNKDLFLVENIEKDYYDKCIIQLDKILDSAKKLGKNQTRGILNLLFPQIRNYKEKDRHKDDIRVKSDFTKESSDSRICVDKHFNKYFTLKLEDNEISINVNQRTI